MAIHRYYESVLETNDHYEQEMAQFMCKAIDEKIKSFDTNFEKMVCVVDLAFGHHYDLKGE
jgi:hypothetical protein